MVAAAQRGGRVSSGTGGGSGSGTAAGRSAGSGTSGASQSDFTRRAPTSAGQGSGQTYNSGLSSGNVRPPLTRTVTAVRSEHATTCMQGLLRAITL